MKKKINQAQQMEDEVLCALNYEEGEGEPFFYALARHCSEVAQSCRVVAEEYRTVAEHGGKRPKRNREEGGSGDDASLKPHRRKRTGSSTKRASLPPYAQTPKIDRIMRN